MVLFIVASLYVVAIFADYYGLAFYAGRFSLALFLAGSVWAFGFLILRTQNQAATESYDLQSMALRATHPDVDPSGSSPIAEALQRYERLARRHESITRARSYSAVLTLLGTGFAAVAAATVLVNIGGFWVLFDFLAVMFLATALLVYALGSQQLTVVRHLDGLLPDRWR